MAASAAAVARRDTPTRSPIDPYTILRNRILYGEDDALKPLKPAVRHLFTIFLSKHACQWNKYRRKRFAISQATLAKLCNASVRSIRRWTQLLEAAGLLRVYSSNGRVHWYEIAEAYAVDRGQPGRNAPEPPRTGGPPSRTAYRITSSGDGDKRRRTRCPARNY